MGKVTRHFCWHHNFVPWGLSVPAPELYTCIKSWKNCIKNQTSKRFFFKLATNDWSDKMFLLTSKFSPQGGFSICPGAIYMYKIMKKMYKIRLYRGVYGTCSKRLTWQEVSVDIKILSPGVVCPWPAYIHLLNHGKMCIKSEVEEILFKPATNDHSDEAFLLTSKFWP